MNKTCIPASVRNGSLMEKTTSARRQGLAGAKGAFAIIAA